MAARQQIVIELVDKVSRALGAIENRLQRVERNTNTMAGGFRGAATAAKGFIGALAIREVAQFANQIVQAAAQMETYTNRLRLVTGSQEELDQVMQLLTDTSIANRASFGDTIDLYSKLRLATESLGVSSEELTNVMNTFQRALAISGADANTASGAIRQFGQAMASGTVRGDEFNSIVEALGPALNIMARESGITVGELRRMSQAGELTAETFFRMLESSSAINQAFGVTQKTINDLEQEVADATQRMFAVFAEESGLAGGYRSFLEDLARAMRRVAGASTSLESATPRMLAFNQELGSASERLNELNTRISQIAFNRDLQAIVEEYQQLSLEVGNSNNFLDLNVIRYGNLSRVLGHMAFQLGITTEELILINNELLNQVDVSQDLQRQIEEENQRQQERQQVIDGVMRKYGDLGATVERLSRSNETYRTEEERLTTALEANTQLVADLERDYAIYGRLIADLGPALEAARIQQENLNAALQRAQQAAALARGEYDAYYSDLIERAGRAVLLSENEQRARDELNSRIAAGIELTDAERQALEMLSTTSTRVSAARNSELDTLNAALRQGLINREEYARLSESLEESLADRLASIQENLTQRNRRQLEQRVQDSIAANNRILDAADSAALRQIGIQERQQEIAAERIRFEKMSEAEKYSFILGEAGNALTALGRYNKRAFEVAKAARIAEAVINTYTGATRALAAYPPPFNFIAAAAVVASGLAQVAAIRAQSYNGYAAGGEMQTNRPAVVGENGPELIIPKQPSVVMPNSVKNALEDMGGGGGGPVTVNFNITTIDAKDFDSLLIDRRSIITGIINDAMTKRGRQGVMS